MALKKNVALLLNETIEHLGIVGDVVSVKPGYARNYLLPLGIAEVPTDEKIEALKEQRATAHAQLEALRAERTETIGKLVGITIKLTRSCNDQGALYGSVTQRDIVDALAEGDLSVTEGAIRLHQPMRRVGTYSVVVQFEKDLRAEVGIEILPDRTLEDLEDEEMEFDNEGELITKPRKKRKEEHEAEAKNAQAENPEAENPEAEGTATADADE